MKKFNGKYNNSKGITLIALVITIIILIILAGVSISVLLGNDGLLNKATHAKKVTDIAQEKEGISIAFVSSKLNNEGYSENVTKEDFDNSLKNQFGENSNIETTDNKDGSFTVTFEDTDRVYYVESNGNIIDNDNMLKISTADELKSFRDDVNSGNTYEGKYVFLTKDITLDISEEWQPIGNRSASFNGIFNGNGYEINGIYINTTEKDQALFGYTNNATIINLGIGEDSDITGGNFTAGIVGTAWNGTNIINCYNKANIIGKVACGGIAGQLTQDGLISQCYNIGKITSSATHAGGICGNADKESSIEKCYNANTITGASNYVGGIIGVIQKDCVVNNCYNAATVSGDTRVGGICGEATGTTASIKNVYSFGQISGRTVVYGITHCNNGATVTNGIYLENTVNGANDLEIVSGVSSKTDTEIKTLTSVLGSAFKEDTNNINNGYPILSWQ